MLRCVFRFVSFLLLLLLLCSLLTEYRIQQKDTLLLLRGGLFIIYYYFNYLYFQIICTHTNDADHVEGNQIGAAGATQLADALQRNSTLTTLWLYG